MRKFIYVFIMIMLNVNTVYADVGMYDTTTPIDCDYITLKLYSIYTANKHTCSAGYYLPANVDACTACPNGYTCAGGTFTFNEVIDQGKTPNVITITYNQTLMPIMRGQWFMAGISAHCAPPTRHKSQLENISRAGNS